ncbi:hypothetical protein ACF0H5_022692 [Mactra antiquata]
MGKDILTLCGAALAALACLCVIISFSTPHWLESYKEANSRFTNLGLWEACFNRFAYDRDSLGKTYDGCSWLFSYEFRPIFDWLNPRWFLAVQIMMTLAMVLTFVTSILCLLGILNFCPPHRASVAQLTNSLLMFASALFITLSIIVFGVKSDVDRQWLSRPDQNFLSWSFGLGVVGGFLSIFSGMCLLVDYLRLKQKQRKARAPPPYSGYKMSTVPPQY